MPRRPSLSGPGGPGPSDPPDRLKGVGPKSRLALAAAGAERIVDLLLNLPVRYEDRTRVEALATLDTPDRWVLVRAEVVRLRQRRAARRRMSLVEAVVRDAGSSLPVVWFNQPWVAQRLAVGTEVVLYGAVRRAPNQGLQLVNPEIGGEDEEGAGLVPVYSKLGPFSGARLRRLVLEALPVASRIEDPLPQGLRDELRVPGIAAALEQLHRPVLPEDTEARNRLVDQLQHRCSPGHLRLAFDELLAISCVMVEHRARRRAQQAPPCVVDDRVRDLARVMLPFQLTRAQRRVVREIAADLEQGHPMARLVQGDVGSGKTVVAALAMLMAVESGHQAALMAPTELLAEQHHATLSRLFESTPYRPGLLTASQPVADQQTIREGLASGAVRLVVGTHALIQGTVSFARLGLAVIDEQHRFGVGQRQALLDKGESPHLVVMTATPIPRSLALTVYGDLELSLIDEMPPGRAEVTTVVRPTAARARFLEFVRGEVGQGGRVLMVYPLIEPSEQIAAASLSEHEDQVRAALPGISVGTLHGRMDRQERGEVVERFRSGAIQVLLATTVVEVGVDVPEATVIGIESADRFGLSQLHQLRGRVGRGSRRSWCVLLVPDELGAGARQRLELLCRSRDGFEIAEADLELRGPGELAGLRQWGRLQLRFAELATHRELISAARSVADRLAAMGRLEAVRRRLALLYSVGDEVRAG